MANRNFNRRQALEKEVKDLYAKVTIIGGEPVLESKVGIKDVFRFNTGTYEIVLDDNYNSLKYFDASVLSPNPDELVVQIAYEEVSGEDKSIGFFTLRGNVLTDPAEGTSLLIKIEVKNTTAV